ncbi:hypothetical protein AGLY_004020 [Aphis glycines]|uniref:Uncharacterized protein n=1 Tax=Aphis glycines TaxID=307491 RepID=A0A6G0TX18_APHGL|nr:hypothetical protein AGLY_004020 [Aphis glycines]
MKEQALVGQFGSKPLRRTSINRATSSKNLYVSKVKKWAHNIKCPHMLYKNYEKSSKILKYEKMINKEIKKLRMQNTINCISKSMLHIIILLYVIVFFFFGETTVREFMPPTQNSTTYLSPAYCEKIIEVSKRRTVGFECGNYTVWRWYQESRLRFAQHNCILTTVVGRCPTAALVAAAGAVMVKLMHYSEKIYFN